MDRRRIPLAKYAQRAVQEFTFGGMENVSATTMSDRILHPDRLEPIADRQGLVAHELAHQWWGDLLTCRDWARSSTRVGATTRRPRPSPSRSSSAKIARFASTSTSSLRAPRASSASAFAVRTTADATLAATVHATNKDPRQAKQDRREAEKLRTKAVKALRRALEQHSFHEEVEQASARALGLIGDAKDFALLLEVADPVRPSFLRLAGVEGLLRLREREAVLNPNERAEVAQLVASMLDDPNMRIRRAVVVEIGELGLSDGKTLLRRVIERDLDDRIRSLAEDELRSL